MALEHFTTNNFVFTRTSVTQSSIGTNAVEQSYLDLSDKSIKYNGIVNFFWYSYIYFARWRKLVKSRAACTCQDVLPLHSTLNITCTYLFLISIVVSLAHRMLLASVRRKLLHEERLSFSNFVVAWVMHVHMTEYKTLVCIHRFKITTNSEDFSMNTL